MSGERLNYLNIGLMLASAVAAFVLPFEVFLFSYAVLGPLHYLTEISWLHERRFFAKHKADYLILGALAVTLLLVALLGGLLTQRISPSAAQGIGTTVIAMAFVVATVMPFLKSGMHRVFALLAAGVAVWLVRHHAATELAFSVFLPTLVHVFLFTGAFVLFGALKSHSTSGIASFVVFLAIPLLFWLTADSSGVRPLSGYVVKTYTHFGTLNARILGLLKPGGIQSVNDIFYSTYGVLVMRFIAYAYTYHYLNWFSKTSVIGWHEVSRRRLVSIGVLWVLSLALYLWNYKTGFIALYCLSFLHVFLEFPLNHLTFVGIVKELKQRNA